MIGTEPPRLSVLLLEDDPMVLAAIRLLLEHYGCAVVTAETAEEAFEQVGRGARPDLILADFQLPGPTDGLQALRTLRARYGCRAPATLVTGDATDSVATQAQAAGVTLLRKPIHPQDIRNLIEAVRQVA